MKRSSGLSAPHSGDSFFFFPSFIPSFDAACYSTSTKVRDDTLYSNVYWCSFTQRDGSTDAARRKRVAKLPVLRYAKIHYLIVHIVAPYGAFKHFVFGTEGFRGKN